MSSFKRSKYLPDQLLYFQLFNLKNIHNILHTFVRFFMDALFIMLKHLLTKSPSVRDCQDKWWFSQYDEILRKCSKECCKSTCIDREIHTQHIVGGKKEGVERMHSKLHIYFESHTQTLCVFTLIWMYLGSKKKNFNFSSMISSSG